MTEKNQKSKDAPVVGQYRKVEFDLWEAWNEFSTEGGALVGNVIRGRDGGKEYKAGFARSWAFAFQFWLKIKASFPKTWVEMNDQELLYLKGAFPDQEALEKYLSQNHLLTDRYRQLMSAIEWGVPKAKGGYDRYKPTYEDLCLCSDFMGTFINVSGIGDIEFRFVNEEKNMFSYGG